MADLTLRINADYAEASKAFKNLADSSEATREKIERFSASFQEKNIDNFIDKQKLLETSMKGTRGEVSAMTAASNNYKKEIERLIASGLDPESEAIVKLRNEQDKLKEKIKETNEAHKAQEQLMKGAQAAAMALFAAIGAGITAMVAATQKTAEAGDQYAKTARIIGMTAETFQELSYAAKASGVNNLTGSLEKLNKTVSDVKSGTGSLTSYLKENNTQLLSQIESVKSNEEAFMLLMDEINKAPDEFSRAELAQAAFGKSGQELILMASQGTDGIKALREEAERYGIISNETAKQSEEYLDAQQRVKAALTGVRNELSSALIPAFTNSINKFAEFIAGIDNWGDKLRTIAITITSVTAAVTAFLVVSKGAAAIHTLSIAIKALMTAITGPAGLASLAIGGLVAGVGALIAIQDKQAHSGEALAKNMDETKSKAEGIIDSYAKLNPGKALDQETTERLIKLYPELNRQLVANSTSVDAAATAIKDLNYQKAMDASSQWIEKLDKEQKYIDGVSESVKRAVANNETWTGSRGAQLGRYKASLKDAENYRDQANAILATVGKMLNPNNEIVDYTNDEIKAAEAAKAVAAAEKSVADEQQRRLEIQEAIKRANESLSGQMLRYQQQLEEIHIKNDDIANDEKQLLELQLKREIASINASKADKQTKDAAISAARELYEEQIRLSEEHFEKQAALEAEQAEAKKATAGKTAKDLKDIELKSIQERLATIPLTEQQIQNEQIDQFQSYLTQRMNMEDVANEERIAWLEEQKQLILESELVHGEEKVALEKSVNDMILTEDKKLKDAQEKLNQEKLKGAATFFSGISELAGIASKDSVGLLIVEKAAASAQALINSYLAFTNALATVPFPFNYAAAAGVLASGIAQQIKIVSTAVPSAETGGRFIVPNSIGSDSQIMRVNPGEEIDVTPRGMTGNNGNQQITVQIDKQTIFDVVNEGLRSNDILIAAVNY